MSHLLMCALLAGMPGQIVPPGEAAGPAILAVDAGSDGPSLTADPKVLQITFASATPLLDEGQGGGDHSGHEGEGDHSGHGGGAHMGPMWIMMGAMMVGMMVAAGAYMMRGSWATPLHAAAPSSPQTAAVPVVPVRPGG